MSNAAAPPARGPSSSRMKLARASIGVFVIRGIDTALSFLIAILLANRFGAGAQLDAFFMARRATVGTTELIKQLVQQIAMPPIAQALDKGQRLSWQTLPCPVLAVIVAMLVVPLLAILFPQPVIALFAPGFTGDRLRIGSTMLGILIPLLPIAVLSALLLTYLAARDVFFFGESARALQRLLLILFLVFLVPPFTILAVGWTMLGAGLVSLSLLGGGAVIVHRRMRAQAPPADAPPADAPPADAPPAADVAAASPAPVRSSPPGRIGSALIMFAYFQLTVMIDFAMATKLPTGTDAALEYGTRLVSLLPGLVTISLSTVLYPKIVRMMASEDRVAAADAVRKMLRGSLFLQLPFSIALAVAAPAVVALLFDHGGFDAQAQAQTVLATAAYALAAIFLMPGSIALNAIFSDAHRSPLLHVLIICGIGLAIRFAAVATMVPLFGLAGLGGAVIAATLITSVLSLLMCKHRFRDFRLRAALRENAGSLLCAGIAALAGWGLTQIWVMPDALIGRIAYGASTGGAVMLVYALFAGLIRQEEMLTLLTEARPLLRRIGIG